MANNERIQLWQNALRSDRYKQTTGTLANEEGHCCLGVACEVAIANGLSVRKAEVGDGSFSYDTETDVMPGVVADWFGVDICPVVVHDDDLDDDGDMGYLDHLNDTGTSFIKIAELLEQLKD